MIHQAPPLSFALVSPLSLSREGEEGEEEERGGKRVRNRERVRETEGKREKGLRDEEEWSRECE